MRKIIPWLLPTLWALLIWRLTTTSQIVVTEEFLLQNILMMGAHFTFFGIQAVFISFALTKSSILNPNFLPVLLTSIYGALVEFRQFSVPGRSADPMDWILDTLGAITFLVIMRKLKNKYYL